MFGIASRAIRPRRKVRKLSFNIESTRNSKSGKNANKMLSTSMGGEYINDYSYDCGIKPYVNALASRIPTPGGGSASAVCASIGLATGTMSAVYTKPKKEKPSLDAAALSNLAKKLQEASFHSLVLAQRDEEAFTALERTWKKRQRYFSY
mmetsp:Transcript_11090/g.12642  ORF Transcript_11090/g.12642 Transcript_11090/m.12642 type:complete len:150 (-) Transcript_11090:446-895(-)